LIGGDKCVSQRADLEDLLAGFQRPQGERIVDARDDTTARSGSAATIERG
jgi:hypothetical protein